MHPGHAADREHRRPGLDRDRVSPHRRVADEDHRAVRRVDLLAVERERGLARDDDVGLLVPERLLGVLLDDVLARRSRVYALIPNASMPSVRRIGFQRTPATEIGSTSSMSHE